MTSPSTRRLLTVKNVADTTGLSVSYLYKLVEARAIPHLRLGSQIRFSPEDLEQWLGQARVIPEATR